MTVRFHAGGIVPRSADVLAPAGCVRPLAPAAPRIEIHVADGVEADLLARIRQAIADRRP